MYLFLCLHLVIISDLLFSMLSSLCRAIASFSLRLRRHRIELWLYDLWVPKISQDIFEVLFADVIFQCSFDSSVSVSNVRLIVLYLILLNVFLWFAYLSLNAVLQKILFLDFLCLLWYLLGIVHYWSDIFHCLGVGAFLYSCMFLQYYLLGDWLCVLIMLFMLGMQL